MRPRKNGLVLLCAAAASLAALTGLSQPSGAVTQTFTATVTYGSAAVVKKTSDIDFPPQQPDPAATIVFMDSYGNTWSQQGGVLQGRPGTITVSDSGNQLINFLTGNLRFNPGLEPLKVICSMHTTFDSNCANLLAPALGKENTVYIAMNVLVNDDRRHKAADGSFAVADSSSSIDVTVVYQ